MLNNLGATCLNQPVLDTWHRFQRHVVPTHHTYRRGCCSVELQLQLDGVAAAVGTESSSHPIKTYVCFLTCSETVLSRQLNLWNAFDAISVVYPRGVAIADNFRRACGVRRQPETRCGELSMQRSIWSPPSRSVHGELTTASWFSSTSGVNPQVPCRMDKHLKCVS